MAGLADLIRMNPQLLQQMTQEQQPQHLPPQHSSAVEQLKQILSAKWPHLGPAELAYYAGDETQATNILRSLGHM